MPTQKEFNVMRALSMVVPDPERYAQWPDDKLTALLVRLWPGTMSNKRHPLTDYQHPENIWPANMPQNAISEADASEIERQFRHECAIMADALQNTPTYADITQGYEHAEGRLIQAYSMHGEMYAHPSAYTVIPTVCSIYGRKLTVTMMYSYQELLPLLTQPPECWSPDVTDSLRRQFRLDLLLHGIRSH